MDLYQVHGIPILGRKKGSPQKTGPGSQPSLRILQRTLCIAENTPKSRHTEPQGSAELWEPTPAFQTLQILLPKVS